jgi:hypothetical protein
MNRTDEGISRCHTPDSNDYDQDQGVNQLEEPIFFSPRPAVKYRVFFQDGQIPAHDCLLSVVRAAFKL